MDDLEKNYERTVDRAVNTVEKGAGCANRVWNGCIIVFANLFFAGFCLWGVYAASISWRLEQEGVTTTGTVVEMEASDSSEGGCCVYSPVIEFTASNDQKYTFEGDTASDPPAYEVGDEVSVIYDPNDPETAQINKWTERWLFPIIIIPAMAIAALVVNIVMLRVFWHNKDSLME
jgi:hypothetical protein